MALALAWGVPLVVLPSCVAIAAVVAVAAVAAAAVVVGTMVLVASFFLLRLYLRLPIGVGVGDDVDVDSVASIRWLLAFGCFWLRSLRSLQLVLLLAVASIASRLLVLVCFRLFVFCASTRALARHSSASSIVDVG